MSSVPSVGNAFFIDLSDIVVRVNGLENYLDELPYADADIVLMAPDIFIDRLEDRGASEDIRNQVQGIFYGNRFLTDFRFVNIAG
jgi:hypothetical protein